MEVLACSGGLDPARLAEAPQLLRSASRAMKELAADIQSCDGTHRKWTPRSTRCGWKAGAPDLEALEAHLLQIWGISAATEPRRAQDKALALQARDVVYLIQNLQDMIHYHRFHSSNPPRLLSHHQSKPLPALTWCGFNCLPFGIVASKPPIKVVHEETLKIGNMLDKAAGGSSFNSLPPAMPPPRRRMPDSGRGVLQAGLFVGRHKEKGDIVQMLIQPCAKPVISLVGAGGIGKTTLAQMVFNDATVRDHFDVKCWVSVSCSSNKMELVVADILRSLKPAWDDKMVDFQTLQSELRRALTSKRYLIVLDDVWNSMDEIWLDMLAPLQSADIGSRIIAIHRIETVPRNLTASSQLYAVNPLNSDDCWALLKEHAFPSDSGDVYPDLHPIGKQIAAKINGSPLAAKLVGGLLGDTRSKIHWTNIMETGLQDDNAVSSVLRLSYKYLPVHLKRCFAYCSLFPEDYKFDPAHLSRLWIAEGFVQPQDMADKRMEDIAREYFDQLLSCSFFQEIKLGPKTYYLVHGLLHDLAKSVAAEDCFRIDDGMNCDIPSTVRHLSVTMNSLPGLTSFCSLEELRTLLIRPSLPSNPSCSQEDFAVNLISILEKSKQLRVLDLSCLNSEELPHCIDDLLHLRYLSIHGSVQRLPESIGKLLHLQVLCFTGKCSFDKLPESVTMLVNLRHLLVETKCTAGIAGIGRLANLQGSLEFHVEKREGHKLEELRNINGLRGLLKIGGLENVSSCEEACKAELNKKTHLNSLNFEWSSASRNNPPPADAKVLEGLQPHQDIKVLHIRRYCGAKAPSWLQSLQQVRSLHLINCRSLGSLPPLGNLGSLTYLHMKELCAVDRIGHEFYGNSDVAFPSLSVLEFDDFPKLCEWARIEDKNSFPCLKRLIIVDCPELVKIPSFPATTREVTIERTSFMPYMRLAPFSSSSEKLQLDVCTTSVHFNGLLHKQHVEAVVALNISGAEQVGVAEEIGSLVSLQRLQLSRCNFTEQNFSNFLQALPCLSSLEMIDLPNITSLPPSETLRCSTMLTELSIRNCQFLHSLSSLQFFDSLKFLVIERCPKVTAASFPSNFSSLKVLRISYCSELQSLPECGLPSSLETLHVIGCHPELSRQSRNMKGHCSEKIALVPSVLIQ
ncbi:putative disease resistance protein RGA3 isoform X1 [Triticum dicoccoides]|uniref:putative disease resistance protein RGA3 isoform X1 n=2 Tax=Triticum dicoccoides TaxID=85692 RepID=UPI00188F6BF4|nr:putative disease resistance protein RGA3 isoform X1 [Triticum dicoccoides]XP_037482885.1 putative disease resistance protein RGA3 isoform X1 [Triticum dicoccoides]